MFWLRQRAYDMEERYVHEFRICLTQQNRCRIVEIINGIYLKKISFGTHCRNKTTNFATDSSIFLYKMFFLQSNCIYLQQFLAVHTKRTLLSGEILEVGQPTPSQGVCHSCHSLRRVLGGNARKGI